MKKKYLAPEAQEGAISLQRNLHNDNSSKLRKKLKRLLEKFEPDRDKASGVLAQLDEALLKVRVDSDSGDGDVYVLPAAVAASVKRIQNEHDDKSNMVVIRSYARRVEKSIGEFEISSSALRCPSPKLQASTRRY